MGKTLPATASPRFTTSSRRPGSTTSSWRSEIGKDTVILVFRLYVLEILVSLALKNKALMQNRKRQLSLNMLTLIIDCEFNDNDNN